MADDTGPTFDPGGAARSVLRSAVADFGAPVLSNPAIVDGICEDRLPEWPREASLISTAARADVAELLQQQAGGVGADTAVRLTAGTLADSRSLDPAACLWVVSEFARALGYQVTGPPPDPARPRAAPPPDPARPRTATPADLGRPGVAPPLGEDPTVLPGAGPDYPEGGHPDGLGHVPTVTSAAPPGARAVPPPAGALPPPAGALPPQAGAVPPQAGVAPRAGAAAPQAGGGPPAPPAPPGRPPVRPGGPNQKVLLAGGAAALLVLYFILAGATHLPPFGKATPTPPPSPAPTSPSPTPTSPSPTPTPGLTATQRTLAALIPASVAADNSCHTVSGGHFGSVAEFACSGAPNVTAGYVNYYLFGTSTVLNRAYLYFLSNFAHSSENTGPCNQVTGPAAFRSFAPCETSYRVGSSSLGGRVMEYMYKGTPDISTTYTSKLVLVNMGGNSNGTDLLGFWDHNKWLNYR